MRQKGSIYIILVCLSKISVTSFFIPNTYKIIGRANIINVNSFPPVKQLCFQEISFN